MPCVWKRAIDRRPFWLVFIVGPGFTEGLCGKRLNRDFVRYFDFQQSVRFGKVCRTEFQVNKHF